MNWQRKAQIQKAIAALPLSNEIYYAMQRYAGSLRKGRANPLDWYQAGRQMAEWIRAAGREVEGMSFLEVGTGRNVNLPTALWLCGAARVVTVDLNPYLSSALVFESNDYARQHEAEVVEAFGAEAERPLFRERLAQLFNFRGSLDGLLKLMNVEYLPRADAASLPLDAHTLDAHVSYAVFEHIPADVLARILAEARRVLKPDGVFLHIVDPSDHFSHDDESITAINFLQFSESDWRKLAGNQFMYHNRLRAVEYLRLFEEAGAHLLRRTETLDEPSLNALRNGFPLHSQFRHIRPEELAVRSLNVLGTFSADSPEGEARTRSRR
jgi:SAM-dependent methyltransferase